MNASLLTQLQDTSHTLVMGILNVTPDSFYDGGRYLAPERAAHRAAQLAKDGAHLLDIGAESSRPGASPISGETERERALPAVRAAVDTGLPVSVDTCRAATARHALEYGAVMVNDITGLRGDPDMAAVIADYGCACVIMHMQGMPATMQQAPAYEDVVNDIRLFFSERLEYALAKGIREDRIWLDPGFGFGKTVAHNLEILRRLDEFNSFGLPVLIGTSNKSTIGAVLDVAADDRCEGTAATVAIAISKGVHCVRVHDVKSMARVARMCDAVQYGRLPDND